VRTFRYILSWYFWILFCFSGAVGVLIEPRQFIHGWIAGQTPSLTVINLLLEVLTLVSAFVFVKAWWVLRRDKRRAKLWCISASLVSLIFPVCLPTLSLISGRLSEFWWVSASCAVPASIGVAGLLFAFTEAAKPLPSAAAKIQR
jgi:hypothetical protein